MEFINNIESNFGYKLASLISIVLTIIGFIITLCIFFKTKNVQNNTNELMKTFNNKLSITQLMDKIDFCLQKLNREILYKKDSNGQSYDITIDFKLLLSELLGFINALEISDELILKEVSRLKQEINNIMKQTKLMDDNGWDFQYFLSTFISFIKEKNRF